ncbi:MAG: amidase [Candidatus Pelagadaptatus aseana]|uniref:amidase n=1 Tax=Candidatus Pelagadaptatus aseana TaxID=3120508 RepID=UPI0039B22D5B
MPDNTLAFLSLTELADRIKSRNLSPVELTESFLSRIERLNPSLHAYNCVTIEKARAQSQAAEQEIESGAYRGPLHGIPLGIKDLLYTQGINTTASSQILKDFVPQSNSTVVDKLNASGAICLGKTNLTEFALSGYHPDLEVPVNPWNAKHWSGVSSSGSGVAVAAHLCCAAIGTDTGGSIRLPSAVNGVVGIKPTYGRVSRHNTIPLSDSLDHIGPMANSVMDAALVLNAIAGWDIEDPTSLPEPQTDFTQAIGDSLHGIKIGVDQTFNAQVDPEVAAALNNAANALQTLGAEIVDVSVAGIEEGADRWFALTAIEAAIYHKPSYPSRQDEFGPVFASLLEHGLSVTAEQASLAYTARSRVKQILAKTFLQVDMLLCPSAAGPAPSLEEFPPQMILPPEIIGPIVMYQAPFNFSGSPTISVPMGFSQSGLPLSLQLVGRHCEESRIIQVAHAYEQATGWHKKIAPAAQL